LFTSREVRNLIGQELIRIQIPVDLLCKFHISLNKSARVVCLHGSILWENLWSYLVSSQCKLTIQPLQWWIITPAFSLRLWLLHCLISQWWHPRPSTAAMMPNYALEYRPTAPESTIMLVRHPENVNQRDSHERWFVVHRIWIWIMGKSLSLDIRERVVSLVETGHSCHEASRRLCISAASAITDHI
jgi:hypothetical protein